VSKNGTFFAYVHAEQDCENDNRIETDGCLDSRQDSRIGINMILSDTNFKAMAAGVLLASASLAHANSIVLTQNPYSYDVGGEFSAAATGDFVANYAATTIMGGEFDTFCIETTVVFNPGQTYTYTLSNQDSMGRALSEGAAFLYYEFAIGQLAGYSYTNPSRNADAGELQAAIWAFQGNQSYIGYPALATDPFYELAINTLGATGANSPDNGRYGVEVLQLWDGSNAAQNQLVYLAGVPDSASTSGMLALACAGLVFLTRRLNQRKPAAIFVTRRNYMDAHN
jgi:hypothetical protein